MAIMEGQKVNLVYQMSHILHEGIWPDDAFKRVADGASVSGWERKNLQTAWTDSVFYKNWAAANPDKVKELCWD